MGFQNKFGVLLIGVNLLLPSLAKALVIQPMKIDSSQGDPLYAEIPFLNAASRTPLRVSVAQPSDTGHSGAFDASQYSHLNFYVQQDGAGNGVIVITSTKPIKQSDINIVLKIQDGNQTRLQQLKAKLPSRIDRLEANLKETTLKPKLITNDKDIQLNLPEVSSIRTVDPRNSTAQSKALQINTATPPPLLKKPTTTPQSTTPAVAASSQPSTRDNTPTALNRNSQNQNNITTSNQQQVPKAEQTNEPHYPNLNIQVTRRSSSSGTTETQNEQLLSASRQETPPEQKPLQAKTPVPQQSSVPKPDTAKTTPQSKNTHVVKANESLWGIAATIAQQKSIPIQQVMDQIHAKNQHAFVGGNTNFLRQGVVLSIPSNYDIPKTTVKQKVQPSPTSKIIAKQEKPRQPQAVEKQTDAHLSIVASDKGAIQGSSQNSGTEAKANNELSLQLKEQRTSTLKLQNNVRQLDEKLKIKEQRIALLNAKLAELEQQLKMRNTTQGTDIQKTSSRTKSVIPALILGTLITFAGLPSGITTTTLQELV